MSGCRPWLLVEDALEDAGGEEGADERGARLDLRTLGHRRGACRRQPALCAGGTRWRRLAGLAGHLVALAGGVLGLLARAVGLLLGLLRLLALLSLLARELLLGLLRVDHLVVGVRGLLLRAARVGGRDLGAQLGGARLGTGALGLRLRLTGGGRGGGLGRLVWLAHSGGSSPNTRRQISAAARVVATDATAPSPASRPDHISRLTISLSVMAGQSKRRGRRDRRRWSRR